MKGATSSAAAAPNAVAHDPGVGTAAADAASAAVADRFPAAARCSHFYSGFVQLQLLLLLLLSRCVFMLIFCQQLLCVADCIDRFLLCCCAFNRGENHPWCFSPQTRVLVLEEGVVASLKVTSPAVERLQSQSSITKQNEKTSTRTNGKQLTDTQVHRQAGHECSTKVSAKTVKAFFVATGVTLALIIVIE